jgi:single-stranded DNA-binding protein
MIKAAISGRLGGDPVQRATRNGKAMVTASAAVNVARAGEDAVTEWIGVVRLAPLASCSRDTAKAIYSRRWGP